MALSSSHEHLSPCSKIRDLGVTESQGDENGMRKQIIFSPPALHKPGLPWGWECGVVQDKACLSSVLCQAFSEVRQVPECPQLGSFAHSTISCVKWVSDCACLCSSHVFTDVPSFCELGRNFWTAGIPFCLLSISLTGDREANGKAGLAVNSWGNRLFRWPALSPGSVQRQHYYLFLSELLMLKCL